MTAAEAPEALALSGALTTVTVAERRDEILRRFADGGDVALDLAAVTEIDAAGVQLLVSARRWAEARGAGLVIAGAQVVVEERLAAMGAPLASWGG